MSFFDQRSTGDLAGRERLVSHVSETLINRAVPLLSDLLLLILYFIVMIRYNLLLSLIGIASVAVTYLAAVLIGRSTVDAQRANTRDDTRLESETYTTFGMIETAKASGREGVFFDRWAALATDVSRSDVALEKHSHLLSGIPSLSQTIGSTVILLLGVRLIMDGEFTIGMLSAFQSVLSMFLQPAAVLMDTMSELQSMRTEMERIQDVEDCPAFPESQAELAEDTDFPKLSGRIELQNVTFGFSRLSPPLLSDVSVTILPGQKIGIVGRSGSGKSTITKLISGLYEPWSGRILYDGADRLAIPTKVFHASIRAVEQEITMFPDTISNNLKMWDPGITDAEMIRSAKTARIHSDIMQRPEGYQSSLGDQGKNFSGGQLQRMEIAGALSADPSIVILDEATSALDLETEKELMRAISERNMTTILIAHRLSTVVNCDQILVIDKGVIAQRGTHQELMEQDGLYREMLMAE